MSRFLWFSVYIRLQYTTRWTQYAFGLICHSKFYVINVIESISIFCVFCRRSHWYYIKLDQGRFSAFLRVCSSALDMKELRFLLYSSASWARSGWSGSGFPIKRSSALTTVTTYTSCLKWNLKYLHDDDDDDNNTYDYNAINFMCNAT